MASRGGTWGWAVSAVVQCTPVRTRVFALNGPILETLLSSGLLSLGAKLSQCVDLLDGKPPPDSGFGQCSQTDCSRLRLAAFSRPLLNQRFIWALSVKGLLQRYLGFAQAAI